VRSGGLLGWHRDTVYPAREDFIRGQDWSAARQCPVIEVLNSRSRNEKALK
jgi:hypothetical protein